MSLKFDLKKAKSISKNKKYFEDTITLKYPKTKEEISFSFKKLIGYDIINHSLTFEKINKETDEVKRNEMAFNFYVQLITSWKGVKGKHLFTKEMAAELGLTDEDLEEEVEEYDQDLFSLFCNNETNILFVFEMIKAHTKKLQENMDEIADIKKK